MDIFESLRGNALIGPSIEKFIENPHDEDVKKELFKAFKKFAPLAAWNRIPLKYDKYGNAINADVATEAAGLTKFFTEGIRPDLGESIYIIPTSNGSSKSYSLHWLAASLLTDSHPTVRTKGEPGDILVLSNSNLIKNEWPKAMQDNPGWLGNREELESEKGCEVITANGDTHIIKSIRHEGQTIGYKNLTTNRCLRLFSYKENHQKVAGMNPHSILIDEFGDQTKGSGDSHTLSKERFSELAVRVGRNAQQSNGVMIMCFTLIFEDWVNEMIEKAKSPDSFIMTDEVTGKRYKFVKVVDGFTSKDNPYLNKKQQKKTEQIFREMGWDDEADKRMYGKVTEDPTRVFPAWRRPIVMQLGRTEDKDGNIIPGRNEILDKIRNNEPGWKWLETMDPGLADKCVIHISAAHPVEGLYVLDAISGRNLEMKEVVRLLKEKEKELGVSHDARYFLGRYFDKFSYSKRSQESPTPAFERWQAEGLFAQPTISKDRSYNDLFALIGKHLVYYWYGLSDLDREIRKHKKDPDTGVPNAKGGDDNIDCLRYAADVYYQMFHEKYHTIAETNSDMPEWLVKRRLNEQIMKERYLMTQRNGGNEIRGLSAGLDPRYL